ncbi:MAG: DMT family transporter [Eubacterium sp.]|jgi:drug/metabolite transporter (DMT)-like permease|nr:DMT family transporter [Eubacterium sp.]
MNKLQVRNSFLLFAAAFIWGTAFVAQSVGMEYIEPFTFSAARSLIGSAFLVPCIFILGRQKNRKRAIKKEDRKELLKGGLVCGVVICIAANLQQVAMLYASVGKSGFLTALYIVIVPLIGILIGRKPGAKLCIAVVCATVGLYLLCMKSGDFSLGFGDALLLLCAVMFSIHILVIDYFTQRVDGVKLSCLQFLVCGVLSLVLMLLFEAPSFSAVCKAWMPLFYTGVLSSGVAYTFQIVGQKGLNPVVASLIMSLESVISAIAGWLVLDQILSKREITGCAVMFAAIILAQLPEKKLNNKFEPVKIGK